MKELLFLNIFAKPVLTFKQSVLVSKISFLRIINRVFRVQNYQSCIYEFKNTIPTYKLSLLVSKNTISTYKQSVLVSKNTIPL